jgi:hypothetical protein
MNVVADNYFKSLRAVLFHLDQAGFRISKSKLYRDKDKGMIRINPDGTVPETEVRAYAATLERKSGSIDDLSDVHARKAAKEVEKLEEQIARLRFERQKEQGKYIPRSSFEAELAARAVVFESGFRHVFNIKAKEWIVLVGGKMEKASELLTALNQALDEQLNSYTSLENFQVMFED